jgi:SAM-dependent methyltransferase
MIKNQAYIDVVDHTGIHGWLAIDDNGGFPEVKFRVNGIEAGAVRVVGERVDVSNYIGREAQSVFAKIARFLRDGENTVEIYYASSGANLPNGLWNFDHDSAKVASDHWNESYALTAPMNIRWWQSTHVVEVINERVCGERLSAVSHGLYALAKRLHPEALPAPRAVSVGGGYGAKEMEAISLGLAGSFDLFEISPGAVERGRALATESGLSDAMNFRLEDAFATVTGEQVYDLVFWNNALHHMSDTRAALEWSRRVLKPGGLLLMDDFVGPTRMQYPHEMIEISSAYRRDLPQGYLASPFVEGQQLSTEVVSPDIDDLINEDPSECCDSGNILPALADVFPEALVIPTGGGVYHLGLCDVLHNIMAAGDTNELDRAMKMDAACLESGMTHYAVAVAKI